MRNPVEAKTESLMTGDVRDYLISHPDFLVSNADLLSILTPPYMRVDSDVRDFQRFMLARLQESANQLRDERDHATRVLQEHLYRQSRLNVAMLSLLEAPSFRAMLRVIESDFPLLLDHEVVELIVEDGEAVLPGVKVVPEGYINEWLPDRDITLDGDIHGVSDLFGDKAGKVRSQALVRLAISSKVSTGMLILGHSDPDYYAGGLATEQILHMAALIELCTRTWLSLPV